MKKISSSWTVFYKKIFPLFWFGILVFAVVTSLAEGAIEEGRWTFLVIPCLMAGVAFVLMKKLVWDLADEVYDCGDSLLVKSRGDEERIPLSNIMNVNASTNSNPPRVTLRLVRPGRFGSEVTFSPLAKMSFNPFAKNAVVEDLIVRVDQARQRRSH